MDIALKNIFKPDRTTSSYCTVVRRLSTTRYEVEDGTGRTRFAESTNFYPPGASVIVQEARIIGRGNSAGKHRVYEV